MTVLSLLTDTHRKRKKIQRVGRGDGSRRGKTCGRGSKGDKSRRGYKRRDRYEGGQMPLYRKLPCRGFAHARFRKERCAINLSKISELYENGEVVNLDTLQQKGYFSGGRSSELKILAVGDLKKKVSIEAHRLSRAAREKLEVLRIPFKDIALSK